MVKKMMYLLCLSITVTLLTIPITIKKSEAETVSEMDIATSPEKVLFDVTNLKPGDWVERTLIIQNKGKQDFHYLFSSKRKQGSKKFYNELLLKVSAGDTVLFDGKMKDLTKLDSRFIAKNNSEPLLFKVVVPERLGNEFQGLSCQVEFKFYVEGTLGGVLPVDGPKLPETGTNLFNILAAGAAFILTGLIWQFVLLRRKKIEKEVS